MRLTPALLHNLLVAGLVSPSLSSPVFFVFGFDPPAAGFGFDPPAAGFGFDPPAAGFGFVGFGGGFVGFGGGGGGVSGTLVAIGSSSSSAVAEAALFCFSFFDLGFGAGGMFSYLF